MFSKIVFVVLLVAFDGVRCEPPAPQYGVPFNNGAGGYNNGGYDNAGQDQGTKTPLNSYGSPNYDASHDHHEYGEPKAYEFGYQVKDDYTGTNYNRQEQSDGNQVTGSYRVALPDGRTQIVTYYADWKTGFHADVRYEGEAQYPDQYNNNGYENRGNGYDNGYNIGYNNGNNGYNSPSNQYGAPINPIAINNQYAGPSSNSATSSVSIKDYSNSGSGYNNNNYDSYANTGFGNKAKPSTAYGAP